ncbi:hypothetical protein RMCC_6466 [Mycolicibacterium canariasense]|uniref:Transmembrane protein n=1 Tax=Mycolicibacterium canariasense TaxID=228230 RepID=A0A100WJM4_MYCCR|nr:hypothetical protein [Mycolicibacterium canariasense]MCV7207242.1 hypothetical protein [Mycolicibacterium canariasense]ORV06527.1 hypothetical protein AWB94_16380 [Mycolicibacterium canariasense]GAS99501.1 hypothetical protein RMCC_6466 [Mycolicibacterium canariasense]
MRRGIAVLWHAASLVLAVALYFFFVLPRWYELTGQWPHTLGTVLRIVCGAVVALTALPVFFTWSRTRKPELGTPTLALSLRVWSMVAHVLAGLLIAGAGISEIWLSLDNAGQWLFGVYGAAAAIALLGAFSFYLAFVAELPPPPPKPLKTKAEKKGRRGRRTSADDEISDTSESDGAPADDEPVDGSAADEATATDTDSVAGNAAVDDTDTETEAGGSKLRNRRPAGKARRGRTRGGVALED